MESKEQLCQKESVSERRRGEEREEEVKDKERVGPAGAGGGAEEEEEEEKLEPEEAAVGWLEGGGHAVVRPNAEGEEKVDEEEDVMVVEWLEAAFSPFVGPLAVLPAATVGGKALNCG